MRDAELRNVAMEACMHRHALQRIEELWGALVIADSVEPKVIVEIGCDQGGTLYAWRAAFPDASVYGVTLTPDHAESYGAVVLAGDSRDRATLQRLKDQLGRQSVDVLFIDGDHSQAGAWSDWQMYSPLVRAGGLTLFHDVAHPMIPEVGATWERVKQDAADSGATVMEIVSDVRPAGFGIVRMAGDN